MEGQVLVDVEYLDGRPNESLALPAKYSPGEEQKICMHILASINAAGGILEFLENGLSLIPMSSIKKLTLHAPSVVGANLADLSNLAMPVKPPHMTFGTGR
jgi:hypothetical protein